MPEMPEVQAIVDQLSQRMVGKVVAAGHLVAFSALKTYALGLESFAGLEVAGVSRHGKFIDIDVDGVHLIFHLARAGWVYEVMTLSTRAWTRVAGGSSRQAVWGRW